MRGWARPELAAGWAVAVAAAVGVRLWNALTGGLLWGYDAWGHVAYVLFLDLYGGIPWPDQGWSYYHPPLHYLLGTALVPLGSAEALVRGLALLGGAASVGTAAIAAWLVGRLWPSRPGFPLLAFCLLAFLPVHIYVSDMPGNEMTHTVLTAGALAAFVANEIRERPRLGGDAATGLLAGLCLLAKFSGLLVLAAVLGSVVLRPLLSRERRELRRAAIRLAVISGAVLVVAGPYYARNVAEFGKPFNKNTEFPLVGDVERAQPPGFRRWTDFVSLSPGMLVDADPTEPPLLHSVWGTAYVGAWANLFRESDSSRALEAERETRRSTTVMAILGLAPTALVLLGAAAFARDVGRGRRREAGVPLLLLWGGTLLAFAVQAWTLPTWPALKAAYLLPLSVPHAVFGVRGMEALGGLPALRRAFAVLLGVAFGGATVVGAEGWVLPRRADSPGAAAAHFYFGEYEEARRIYGRLVATSRHPIAWLDNLAAVEIADGRPEPARRLYARAREHAEALGLRSPYRRGQLAVAEALAGDAAGALRELDAALAEERLPELLANRGALRAHAGDLEGALRDLRAALEVAPGMTPAWRNLVRVLEARGAGEAAAVRERAARAACRSPRHYPYGLGTGEVLDWGVGRRWLLLLEDDGLRAAGIPFYRDACRRLRRAAADV